MKKLVFIFTVICNFLFAQDQIVLRQTFKVIWKELEIKKITIDSISYLPQGKNTTIITLPIKEIIAYRKDYESNPYFIFPNPEDKEIYKIQNGNAIHKNVFFGLELFLKSHEILRNYSEDSLIGENLVAFKKIDSSRYIINKGKAKMYVILKSKPYHDYGYKIVLKKYKFSTDSTLFFEYTHKKESAFYSIKFSDLKCVGIQTTGTITARIVLGLIQIAIPPIAWHGIYRLAKPIYRELDVEHEWQIVVTKKIKKR